uniref:Putative transcriptional coactivator caper rrm superfamily n=1 Tax=Anopheles darlingi TaxID=43151 RepID=A0A2M4CGM0_ANODA
MDPNILGVGSLRAPVRDSDHPPVGDSTAPSMPGFRFGTFCADGLGNQPADGFKWAAFNPSLYKNVANERVDWGALAQQWIQMRETLAPAPPSPAFVVGGMRPPPSAATHPASEQLTPSKATGTTAKIFEEQGEAPMEVERDEDGSSVMVPMPPPPVTCERDWAESKWSALAVPCAPAPPEWLANGTSWPMDAADAPATSLLPTVDDKLHIEAVNSSSQQKVAPASSTLAVGRFLKQHPASNPSHSASPAASTSRWQPKQPPGQNSSARSKESTGTKLGTRSRFTAIDTPVNRGRSNHLASSEIGYAGAVEMSDHRRLPGLMDNEIRLGGTGGRSVRSMTAAAGSGPLPPIPLESRKLGQTVGSGETVTLNDAKRKLLPAWIREGLEKMEKEKQRKVDQARDRWRREEVRPSSPYEHDDDDEPKSVYEGAGAKTKENEPAILMAALPKHDDDIGGTTARVYSSAVNSSATFTRQQQQQQLNESMRAILTNILLEVTNEEIVRIAKETTSSIKQQQQQKQKQYHHQQQQRPALPLLGLEVYGDSDDDEESSDEQHEARQEGPKPEGYPNAVASDGDEAGGSNGSSGDNNTNAAADDDDDDDDSSEQYLQKRIRRKQREFQLIARKIEKQLLKEDGEIETQGQQTQHQQETDGRTRKKHDEDEDEGEEGADDNDDDGSDDGDCAGHGEKGYAPASDSDSGSSEQEQAGLSLGQYRRQGDDSAGRSGGTIRPDHHGEPPRVNVKLNANLAYDRRRRDRRTSRFSDLLDTVRQTHVTHVAIMQTSPVKQQPIPTSELADAEAVSGKPAQRPLPVFAATGPVASPLTTAGSTAGAGGGMPKMEKPVASCFPNERQPLVWSIGDALELQSDASTKEPQHQQQHQQQQQQQQEQHYHHSVDVGGGPPELNHRRDSYAIVRAPGGDGAAPSTETDRRHQPGSAQSSDSEAVSVSESNRSVESSRSRSRRSRSRSHSSHSHRSGMSRSGHDERSYGSRHVSSSRQSRHHHYPSPSEHRSSSHAGSRRHGSRERRARSRSRSRSRSRRTRSRSRSRTRHSRSPGRYSSSSSHRRRRH